MRTRIKELIIKFGYFVLKSIRAPFQWYRNVRNIQTQGVQIMIIHNHQIILVRHWYNPLWVMPGGGIKKYETPEQAAIREIKEELGLKDLQLEYRLGKYLNKTGGKNDIVHCFVVLLDEKFIIKKRFNFEISDVMWSDYKNVPQGTSKATKQRIQEFIHQDISNDIRIWS